MSLSVEGLTLELPRTTGPGRFSAIRELDLSVSKGQSVALIGASASGKSLVALALLGIVPPGGSLSVRRYELDGRRLALSDLKTIRGRTVGFIPQEARAALDPLRTVGRQLKEGLRLHGFDRVNERARSALAEVQLDPPEEILVLYPHELSGGMAQRVLLAMAIALEPKVLIADEPTTALDAVLQVQILETLQQRVRNGAAMVLITHDLDAVQTFCDRAVVLFAGRTVESAPVSDLAGGARHPYVRALFEGTRVDTPPDLEALPGGCAYHPACSYARPHCREVAPRLEPLGARAFACYHPLGESFPSE